MRLPSPSSPPLPLHFKSPHPLPQPGAPSKMHSAATTHPENESTFSEKTQTSNEEDYPQPTGQKISRSIPQPLLLPTPEIANPMDLSREIQIPDVIQASIYNKWKSSVIIQVPFEVRDKDSLMMQLKKLWKLQKAPILHFLGSNFYAVADLLHDDRLKLLTSTPWILDLLANYARNNRCGKTIFTNRPPFLQSQLLQDRLHLGLIRRVSFKPP
ncbi:hypothetical protein G2W53_002059 [Senna tora]|uniref:Uncharacterized protein n=1 Tax=Senna tora TaxID=362788 RepID=A0A834XH34_9FABA|nr:hypothetical protein G2W53_002059 [Senna tora]